MKDGTDLLVPKPLCWSCLEQEAVTGFWSAGVPKTWNLTGFSIECMIWKCHLALVLWAVVSEDATKL